MKRLDERIHFGNGPMMYFLCPGCQKMNIAVVGVRYCSHCAADLTNFIEGVTHRELETE